MGTHSGADMLRHVDGHVAAHEDWTHKEMTVRPGCIICFAHRFHSFAHLDLQLCLCFWHDRGGFTIDRALELFIKRIDREFQLGE